MLTSTERNGMLAAPLRHVRSISRPWELRLPTYLLFWTALWANMNTGQWNLRNVQGMMGYASAFRAVLPLLAAAVAIGLLSSHRARSGLTWSGPAYLLASFGIVALLSTAVSASPITAAYWGGLYLSVFLVLEATLAGGNALARCRWLLALDLAVVVAFLLGVVWVGRHLIAEGDSLYAINVNVEPVPGIGMVRSSGASRYAAIVALACLITVIWGKGELKFLLLIPFVWCVDLVLDMQSRGSLFGLVMGIGCVLFLWRGAAALVPLGGALVLVALARPEILDSAFEYITRGAESEKLMTLTGRTGRWLEGLELFLGSPLTGLGPMADRIHMGWAHIHNAWVNALVQGGIVGVGLFVAAWGTAWRLLLRNRLRVTMLPSGHQVFFVVSGAILAFFTIRTISESTGAIMSPELLVLVPIFAYLELLDKELNRLAAQEGPRLARAAAARHPVAARAGGRWHALGG